MQPLLNSVTNRGNLMFLTNQKKGALFHSTTDFT